MSSSSSSQPRFHHTLREDLIKDVLIWAGSFFALLAVAFILTLDGLVNYMIAEIAEHRMGYQIEEFSKHLSQGDTVSISEESDALVQNESITGIILVDASGVLAQVALKEGESPRLNISAEMNAEQLRRIVESDGDLMLFEARIPAHSDTLVLIMDKRPVLNAIYTSTAWTALLLFAFVGLSILALHISLRKHLIEPIDEVRHIIDDDLTVEDKQDLISHLPDEVAMLATSYEKTNEAHLLMERQFHQAQKMEAIGTLVGGIAHDFNNTLAGINGNLYLAKLAVRDLPDVSEKLQRIEKLSRRSSETVKNLLTFAHKTKVETVPLVLGPFIKEAIKLNRVSVPENVKLEYDVLEEGLVVKSDASQLHQVLLNLINNAFHATEGVAEQKIVVAVKRYSADEVFQKKHGASAECFACISVSDNGHGISEKELEHIFEPFYTTKEIGKGTGLGLAMVYGSIKSQQGVVEVESRLNHGSTFNVYLPLVEAEEMTDITSEDVARPGGGECILLADDEEGVLLATSEVLESLNYRVISATDGQQAVHLYEKHRDEVKLIILDIVMPTMGGFMAARKIRDISPMAKVLFVTGYDDKTFSSEEGEEIEELIVHKPYAVEDLSKLIRQQLDC